ncbi:ankyrin repeat-containing protein ITN1-like isoform X3 [Juglans microcarpa x Juglans regia]|uniref:ankyrin repeat-containing protein ITN1-like isoform X3 n=1 Tax=Juglans microcarpa x Juglans regia TaxID=2249226 RepID=UPI001B7DC040|nr:ankyrin repeat-containing protein ITN1-like isoform X3 [Juglans microcarpa x Juglans regia]
MIAPDQKVEPGSSSNNPGRQNLFNTWNADYYMGYAPLHKALQSGDWNSAKEFLKLQPNSKTAKITTLGKTALHVSVEAGHVHIVEALVELMSEDDLELQDNFGDTALVETTYSGQYKMAECMLRKNKKLVSMGRARSGNESQMLPVVLALSNGYIKMARYLYSLTPLEDLFPENGRSGSTLCTQAIYTRALDIALDLIRRYPRLVLAPDKESFSPLYALASMKYAFPSGHRLVFWKRWISSCIHIQSANGTTTNEVHLIIQKDEGRQSDAEKTNKSSGMPPVSIMLNRIPGAALQMQRELQWFKEVESIVHPKVKEVVNNDDMTPRELFTKNHKDLMKEGETWMKDTSTSCTVVAALIITIMFAAAFTVPGGNNDNGLPIFFNKKLFRLFIIADSLSLFSSASSVLMFMGILTSRYAEEDFFKSLPTKMIIGLSTLFFSIATMMIAFSTGLLLMLGEESWMVIPVISLASIPVTLFVLMQFPLLVDMYISTYGPGIFDRKMKRWL